jgi:acetate kinase
MTETVMKILTVNAGSTSTRLALFTADPAGRLTAGARQRHADARPRAALASFASELGGRRVDAVAHRVVHGGVRFTEPVMIDSSVRTAIDESSALAPLHNPIALEGIDAAEETFGTGAVQVAVFDTAFFARLPRIAAEYAVPGALGTDLGVRRYGFHGIAHEAMWQRWCELMPVSASGGRLISLQLGGGCSMAAVRAGRPIDTSMGFSPLEGLVMASRSGDIDAAVVPYLASRLGCTADEVIEQLNRESGLLGVSGRSSDLSELLANASAEARFAIDLYSYRAKKYLGAYLAALGGCDGIVFGGGVGEHVPAVREQILRDMGWAGIELDLKSNGVACGGEAKISAASSAIAVHVIPADEELALARAVLALKS